MKPEPRNRFPMAMAIALSLILLLGVVAATCGNEGNIVPTQTALATPTFDRDAALTAIAPTPTTIPTSGPVPAINPRNLSGTDCTGTDSRGVYAYKVGEGFHEKSSDGRYRYYEQCVDTQEGPKLMILEITVPASCGLEINWNSDLSGVCKDSTGAAIPWPPPMTRYQ